MLEPNPDFKFVILQGLERGNRFFTSNCDKDPRITADGKISYKILGFADTVEEAQTLLYGEDWVKRERAWKEKQEIIERRLGFERKWVY